MKLINLVNNERIILEVDSTLLVLQPVGITFFEIFSLDQPDDSPILLEWDDFEDVEFNPETGSFYSGCLEDVARLGSFKIYRQSCTLVPSEQKD